MTDFPRCGERLLLLLRHSGLISPPPPPPPLPARTYRTLAALFGICWIGILLQPRWLRNHGIKRTKVDTVQGMDVSVQVNNAFYEPDFPTGLQG